MNFLIDTWEIIHPILQFGARVLDYIIVGLIILWIYKLTRGSFPYRLLAVLYYSRLI